MLQSLSSNVKVELPGTSRCNMTKSIRTYQAKHTLFINMLTATNNTSPQLPMHIVHCVKLPGLGFLIRHNFFPARCDAVLQVENVRGAAAKDWTASMARMEHAKQDEYRNQVEIVKHGPWYHLSSRIFTQLLVHWYHLTHDARECVFF